MKCISVDEMNDADSYMDEILMLENKRPGGPGENREVQPGG